MRIYTWFIKWWLTGHLKFWKIETLAGKECRGVNIYCKLYCKYTEDILKILPILTGHLKFWKVETLAGKECRGVKLLRLTGRRAAFYDSGKCSSDAISQTFHSLCLCLASSPPNLYRWSYIQMIFDNQKWSIFKSILYSKW